MDNKKSCDIDFALIPKDLFKNGFCLKESNISYSTFKNDDDELIPVFCVRVVMQKGKDKNMYNIYKNSIRRGEKLTNQTGKFYYKMERLFENETDETQIMLREFYTQAVAKYTEFLTTEESPVQTIEMV